MNKEDNLKSIIAFGKKISISNDFKLAKLGEVVDIDNKHRKAISQKNRIKGKYPYCGATKIQDYIDDYAFDGKRLLIGEDGADWGTGKDTTYIMNGKFNVNNHAHVLKEKNVPINFLKYYLNYFDLDNYITGAVIKKLTKQNLLDIDVFYDEKNVHKIVSILDQQQGLIDSYKEKLSLLEEQEAYYQDELLSGRLRIRLTDESINYATQQGWYLNDDLVEGKEKEFEEWIAVDFHSKVEFYKETEFKEVIFFNRKTLIPKDFKLENLSNVVSIENKNRKAISQKDRVKGEYPYCGATKIQDYIKDYNFEGEHLLIGEDGADWGARANTSYIMNDRFNVNNHAHVLKENGVPIDYIKVYLNHFDLSCYITGAVIKKLTKENLQNINFIFNKKQVILSILIFKNITTQKNLIKEKIKVEEEKMDYLMDELLSGRIRVK